MKVLMWARSDPCSTNRELPHLGLRNHHIYGARLSGCLAIRRLASRVARHWSKRRKFHWKCAREMERALAHTLDNKPHGLTEDDDRRDDDDEAPRCCC